MSSIQDGNFGSEEYFPLFPGLELWWLIIDIGSFKLKGLAAEETKLWKCFILFFTFMGMLHGLVHKMVNVDLKINVGFVSWLIKNFISDVYIVIFYHIPFPLQGRGQHAVIMRMVVVKVGRCLKI